MSKRNYGFLMAFACCVALIPGRLMAFAFLQRSATAYMNATSFPSSVGNITSPASDIASVNANGWPDPPSRDKVTISQISFSTDLSNKQFTLQVKVGDSSWLSPDSALQKCVWVDANCTVYSSTKGFNNQPTVPVSIRLLRNSTDPYDVIPSGTTIATIQLTQYSNAASSGGDMATLYFKFNGNVTPIVPTCNVTSFDKTVTLPAIYRSDLTSKGIGRYPGISKNFNINLACENNPKVSVTFNGDKMPDVVSEDVLSNLSSGNENVGIQLLFNDNPLKIGDMVEVIDAAGENESLTFGAYYYYKGGDIQGGAIKSQTEFLFNYE